MFIAALLAPVALADFDVSTTPIGDVPGPNLHVCDVLDGALIRETVHGCDFLVRLSCEPLYFMGDFVRCRCTRNYVGYTNATSLSADEKDCCEEVVSTDNLFNPVCE